VEETLGGRTRHRDLNVEQLSSYTVAKVVLLGDSGVGKSGLALALCWRPFAATAATHSRSLRTLELTEHAEAGRTEHREILLWDLAGQPSYGLIHPLSMDSVNVAVVVFDPTREEIDDVRHWSDFLRSLETSRPPGAPHYHKMARLGNLWVTGGISALGLSEEAVEFCGRWSRRSVARPPSRYGSTARRHHGSR